MSTYHATLKKMTAPIFGLCRHRIPIDGEGVTTLVTFSHCPLHCSYCLNPQCEDTNAIIGEMTCEDLMTRVKIDNLYFLATGGGVTFGGGEPCLRSEFIADFKQLCKTNPDSSQWRLTIETSLAVAKHHIECLIPVIDQWIIDIKDMHSEVYERYTGHPISSMFRNLQCLADRGLQDRCLIRVPLIPEFNTPEMQEESVKMLKDMGFMKVDRFEYKKK